MAHKSMARTASSRIMATAGLCRVLSVAGLVAVVRAQQAGWESNQVNATMCYWEQLRANVIQDTVYMDGGNLWWLPGLSDGSYGDVTNDNNPLGLVYTLNFSVSFSTSQNITALMGTLSKAPNGGAANNFAPNYVDGAMLANYYEWFLYGGLQQETAAFSTPPDNEVIAYEEQQYGVQKNSFRPGFLYDTLPSGMTTYVAYGGAASAPSENKAWYFSGMRSPDGGPIYTVSGNDSLTAVNVSNTLIKVDMTTQQQETWTNVTLPANVSARAGPELVWVPVGAHGILVALGGVLYPEWVNVDHVSDNEAASEADSPAFMSTIDIYDVASGNWFAQPTTGGPGALTRGCAVVAPAQDYSSFNIYYYGGYDGLHLSKPFNDDVWVLSLPSFTWTKVSSGNSTHARAGHKCVMPYPDQMMVIGGYTTESGEAPTCLNGGIVQLFNLSSGEWLEQYNASVWAPYQVPSAVYGAIGGSPTGGATATTPKPSGWATPSLASVFATPYATEKIITFYPYATAPANTTAPTAPPASSGSGVPSYLGPVLGVVLGLVVLTSLVVCIFLCRRRRAWRSNRGTGTASDVGTDENGNRIISWMRGQQQGQQSETKTATVTSDETPLSPDTEFPTPSPALDMRHEMADTQVAELPDTSRTYRAELHDTGLTPVEVIDKHTRLGGSSSGYNPGRRGPSSASGRGSLNSPSHYSSISQADHASSISGGGVSSNSRSQTGAAAGLAPARPQQYSGMSGLSDATREHLRQLSDGSVSSTGVGGAAAPVAELYSQPQGSDPSSPQLVSPPTADSPGSGGSAADYLSARPGGLQQRPSIPRTPSSSGAGATGSPQRKSVFQESREDLR